MKNQKIIEFWIKSPDDDFRTMNHLFKTKDYSWSLFIGHLVVEKLLRAYHIQKVDKNFPFTHNLTYLISQVGLKVDDDTRDFLSDLNTFNINSRYDEYKKDFRKKCTKKFTESYIFKIQEFRKWLKIIIKKQQ